MQILYYSNIQDSIPQGILPVDIQLGSGMSVNLSHEYQKRHRQVKDERRLKAQL